MSDRNKVAKKKEKKVPVSKEYLKVLEVEKDRAIRELNDEIYLYHQRQMERSENIEILKLRHEEMKLKLEEVI